MLSPTEIQRLRELLQPEQPPQAQPQLVEQPRTVEICGIPTRYCPPTGAQLLRVTRTVRDPGSEDAWVEALLELLKTAFPELQEQYGIENLSVAALRQCLEILVGGQSTPAQSR